jgi:arginine repressor
VPRKAKVETPAPEVKSVEAAPEAPRGARTAAVKEAVKANRKKSPKEISELLKEQGWDVTGAYVSNIKFQLGIGRKKKAKAAAPEAAATPVVPKDAVSLGLLQKAKKLAAQFSSIKEAKAAMDALAQILD